MRQEDRLKNIAKVASVVLNSRVMYLDSDIYDLVSTIIFLAGESDLFLSLNSKNIEDGIAKYDEMIDRRKSKNDIDEEVTQE